MMQERRDDKKTTQKPADKPEDHVICKTEKIDE